MGAKCRANSSSFVKFPLEVELPRYSHRTSRGLLVGRTWPLRSHVGYHECPHEVTQGRHQAVRERSGESPWLSALDVP